MHILLINPNRYKYPPVIPVGLEYLAGSLKSSKHDFSVLDLCFSQDAEQDIVFAISANKPEIVAFTIRQVDTVLYHNNEFFLDEIKKYVAICKAYGCKVVLGGAGFSIMPDEILNFLEADYGISGPGEISLIKLLDALNEGGSFNTITDGYKDFSSHLYPFKRLKIFDYKNYLSNDGITGFRTQIGCDANCVFCTEANKKIIFHIPEMVATELMELIESGSERFHLCDSEFNMNLEHSISVCKSIEKTTGPVDWALYLKLYPYSPDLFRYLNRSGATMLTLSLNTELTDKKYYEDIVEFIELANHFNIKVAIDLSTGFPYEHTDNLKWMVELLNKTKAQTIGVNAFYRVYPNTLLFRKIMKDENLKQFLINYEKQTGLIRPVFYNSFPLEDLQKIIGNNRKFRIEGFEKATNYQRIKNNGDELEE